MNGIILAAGLSSRMGQDKAFLRFHDKPIIEILVEKLSQFCNTIIIVGGNNFSNLNNFFLDHPLQHMIKIVHNKNFHKGMFSSIRMAVKNLPDESPFFLQMIDQPFVETIIYKQMVESYENDYFVLQPHGLKEGVMRSGHPILINFQFAEVILAHEDIHNLRDIIREYPKKRKFILVQNSTIFDNLNTRKLFLEKVKKVEHGNSNSSNFKTSS